MGRKKWAAQTEITEAILKFREKRKWQIALRRYVLEKNPCFDYAPYFGLDINSMRGWFENQFQPGIGWDDFATQWQFEHIIPVTYFDFSNEAELKMCWNFTNIKVEFLQKKERSSRPDLLVARNYFRQLYDKTNYATCLKLLDKIDRIEFSELPDTQNQQQFITKNREYLDMIAHYTAFEFELLNSGRDMNEVNKEIEFMKKYHQ
jgi:hypothetical protein